MVTGGCGYVGRYLVEQLSKKHKIAVYDNITYEPHYLDPYEFYFGDVCCPETYINAINDFKPDIIINLASITGDPACSNVPILAKQVNEDSVKWLCENFSGKIIHISTCSTFGINNDLLNEKSKTNPISVYAETKLNSEKYLREGDLCFRLGTLYGCTSGRPRLDLVVNIFSVMCALGESLTVTGRDAWRPLLHVKDVTTGIELGIDKGLSGLYLLAERNCQIGDIAEEIVCICGEGKVKFEEIPATDLRNYKVDFSKISREGFKPKFTLSDGVLEIYNMVKKKRVKDPFASLYHNGKFAYEHLREV